MGMRLNFLLKWKRKEVATGTYNKLKHLKKGKRKFTIKNETDNEKQDGNKFKPYTCSVNN